MSERCTGHCCRVFTLPYSPEELRAGNYLDGLKVADMVIPLGSNYDDLADDLKAMLPEYTHVLKEPRFGFSGFYTCKNLDRETGNCMDYENRPDMCSRYPDGARCMYRGCTSPCGKLTPVEDFGSDLKSIYPQKENA